MSSEVYINGVRREFWNDATRTYTAYNAAGAQTSTRAYTPAENAVADAVVAQKARETNQTTLTAQATTAITANETWMTNTAPLVQAAMDAIQAKTWPAKPGASSTVAQVNAVLDTIWTQVLAPLVQQGVDQSQSIETLNIELVNTKKQLDATMRLVAGALDSTSGT